MAIPVSPRFTVDSHRISPATNGQILVATISPGRVRPGGRVWTSGPDSMYKYVEADLALLGWLGGWGGWMVPGEGGARSWEGW